MSELLFPVGLVGVFLAVALAGVAVELSNAERRRAVDMLRSQVVRTRVSLREEELAKSFSQRALLPVLSWFQRTGLRVTPLGMRRRIAERLITLGSPAGWDTEKVAALKLVGAFAGLALSL